MSITSEAPTVWTIARRPRWIALLVLALVISAGFAALGKWQLERSVVDGTVVERETETVVPLEDLTEPQTAVGEVLEGQRVRVSGTLVPGDFVILGDRVNGDDTGYWVAGHLVTTEGASLAVGLGWAVTQDAAEAGLRDFEEISGATVDLAGRYISGEAPQQGEFEEERASGIRTNLSPAELVNVWAGDPGETYAGYVAAEAVASGVDLVDIVSPAPSEEVSLNWLNIFYAVEWVVFAGFALFLWYRLVRDQFEREQEEAAEAREAAAAHVN